MILITCNVKWNAVKQLIVMGNSAVYEKEFCFIVKNTK